MFEALEKSIRRHYYDNKEDAVEAARRYQAARELAGQGKRSDGLFESPEGEGEAEGQKTLF